MGTRAAEQVSTSYAPPPAYPSATERIRSIDFIRGIVMILMAIDHVRVYSGVPAGGDTVALFFTRWVTHFCAPVFVFLAGTAAYFHGRKLANRAALTKYLVTRGALLVVLELTVVKFFWSFGLDYGGLNLAGVIWMLGWCMIILGGLVRLSPRVIGWLGLGIMLLQQLFGVVGQTLPMSARQVWEFIYPVDAAAAGGIAVLYVLVPWIGVMAAGYGFGLIMEQPAENRNRLLARIGIAAVVAFLVVASLVASRGGDQPFVFRLLGQQKYPASQLFLLMTLGPMVALLPLAERARGTIADAIDLIGRVPMFYYLAHIPVIHLSALAVNAMRTGVTGRDWYATAPFTAVPEDQRWPLWLLYAVFAIDVLILYAACRAYARRKRDQPRPWMRYI